MKLKYAFETMELDDHIVAVPVGEGAKEFRGVVKLNESAAEIFNLFREETTEEKVVTELQKKHDDEPNLPVFVHEVVEYLAHEGIL